MSMVVLMDLRSWGSFKRLKSTNNPHFSQVMSSPGYPVYIYIYGYLRYPGGGNTSLYYYCYYYYYYSHQSGTAAATLASSLAEMRGEVKEAVRSALKDAAG